MDVGGFPIVRRVDTVYTVGVWVGGHTILWAVTLTVGEWSWQWNG